MPLQQLFFTFFGQENVRRPFEEMNLLLFFLCSIWYDIRVINETIRTRSYFRKDWENEKEIYDSSRGRAGAQPDVLSGSDRMWFFG